MTQLLDGGAAVDQAKGDGKTSLWIACQQGRVDAARLLLNKGAEVDRANQNGATPLYVACQNGHVAAARLLLENGAEVNRTKENGWTPLLIACWKGHSRGKARAVRTRSVIPPAPAEIRAEDPGRPSKNQGRPGLEAPPALLIISEWKT